MAASSLPRSAAQGERPDDTFQGATHPPWCTHIMQDCGKSMPSCTRLGEASDERVVFYTDGLFTGHLNIKLRHNNPQHAPPTWMPVVRGVKQQRVRIQKESSGTHQGTKLSGVESPPVPTAPERSKLAKINKRAYPVAYHVAQSPSMCTLPSTMWSLYTARSPSKHSAAGQRIS